LSDKKNILIIGDGGRKDILSMFDDLINSSNLIFLLHKAHNSFSYSTYGKTILWEDYRDAFYLLEKNKIDKTIFLQYGDYNEIAIRTACNENSIPSYMLSHGLLDYNNYNAIKNKSIEINKRFKNRLKNSFIGSKLSQQKNRFYFNTLKISNKNNSKFLHSYFKIRSRKSMLESFALINHENLKLNKYLCFNDNCVNWYSQKHQLTKEETRNCKIIGIPYFDHYATLSSNEINSGSVIFIDQPFFEQSLWGWTENLKTQFINDLLAVLNGKTLYIKPHPTGNINFWKKFKKIKIIENNWLDKLSETTIILGFYSTLLIPLAALPNKVMFTFENHPIKKSSKEFSFFLTQSQVAKKISSIQELKEHFNNLERIQNEQNAHKIEFAIKWLCKFDGKSKERLTKFILS